MAHKAISKSIGEMLQEQVICETAMQSNSAQQKQTLVAPIKNPLTRHSYRCQRKKKHVLSIKKNNKNPHAADITATPSNSIDAVNSSQPSRLRR